MLVRSISLPLAALLLSSLMFTSTAQAEHGLHHGHGVHDGTHHGLHHGLHHGRGDIVCRDYQYGNPDLFYNFYVPPNCGGVGTAIYPSPLPVPAHVGHTYYTYQPLMPHEFLYKHHRSYHRYYNEGRGLTRTCVHWW